MSGIYKPNLILVCGVAWFTSSLITRYAYRTYHYTADFRDFRIGLHIKLRRIV